MGEGGRKVLEAMNYLDGFTGYTNVKTFQIVLVSGYAFYYISIMHL